MRLKKLPGTQKFLFGIIIAYCVLVSVINPAFLSLETLFDILRSASGTMILATAILVVMISGGIDISSTTIAIFGAYATTSFLINSGIDSLLVAFTISTIIGIFFGLINGLLVHALKLEPFIITLGTANIFYGFMTILIGTHQVGANIMPTAIKAFGQNKLFTMMVGENTVIGLSVFIIPVIIILIITWFLLRKTTMGRGIFALGCSEESAKRVGFNTFLLRLFIYGFAGALAGAMGILYTAGTNTLNPISLVGTELSIIAAVVIGGARPSGGRGSIFGTILGVAIMTLFNSTLVFLGLSSSWNDFFVGVVLLVSIIVTSYQQRLRNRKNFIFTE